MAQSVLYRLISRSPYHSKPPLTLTRFFSCLRRGSFLVSAFFPALGFLININIFPAFYIFLVAWSPPPLLHFFMRCTPHHFIFFPRPFLFRAGCPTRRSLSVAYTFHRHALAHRSSAASTPLDK